MARIRDVVERHVSCTAYTKDAIQQVPSRLLFAFEGRNRAVQHHFLFVPNEVPVLHEDDSSMNLHNPSNRQKVSDVGSHDDAILVERFSEDFCVGPTQEPTITDMNRIHSGDL